MLSYSKIKSKKMYVCCVFAYKNVFIVTFAAFPFPLFCFLSFFRNFFSVFAAFFLLLWLLSYKTFDTDKWHTVYLNISFVTTLTQKHTFSPSIKKEKNKNKMKKGKKTESYCSYYQRPGVWEHKNVFTNDVKENS